MWQLRVVAGYAYCVQSHHWQLRQVLFGRQGTLFVQEPQTGSIGLGTSTASRNPVRSLHTGPGHGNFCHSLPDSHVECGQSLSNTSTRVAADQEASCIVGRYVQSAGSQATAKDEEEIGDPYSGGPIFEQDEATDTHEEATTENSTLAKQFIPKLESKLADTTTQQSWQGRPDWEPPSALIVLKGMGSNMSDTDFCLASSFNMEELHNAQIALRQEVFRSMTA
ncbi:hypothetical protein ACA910_003298 [Epithemia clementina (nom. ined.)]